MFLIGDIHGLFYEYKQILKRNEINKSLQLGDLGLGFPSTPEIDLSDIEGDHKFLRGNHDNPEVCRQSKYYIGDYGILNGDFIDGFFNKLMFISGAWSIDEDMRTPGISWWEDEQLSYNELSDVVNLYLKETPDIICSHDCPTLILSEFYPYRVIPTRTSQAMDSMIQHRMPSYWFFGHHHKSWKKKIYGCTFICLNELEILNISRRI